MKHNHHETIEERVESLLISIFGERQHDGNFWVVPGRHYEGINKINDFIKQELASLREKKNREFVDKLTQFRDQFIRSKNGNPIKDAGLELTIDTLGLLISHYEKKEAV